MRASGFRIGMIRSVSFLWFDMTEFEKIVYLDSDMMVLENIDELFALPHMSAVNAGRSFPGNSNWKDLNSGILVVEPRAGLIDQLTKVILELADYDDAVSDQNVLHYLHQDWPTKRELHLDEQYNIFDRYIDYYVKELAYGLFRSKRRISVVHFIGPTKPWMRTWTKQVRHMIWLARRLKYYEIAVNLMYLRLLMKTNVQLYLRRYFRSPNSKEPA
jgi:glycogenin